MQQWPCNGVRQRLTAAMDRRGGSLYGELARFVLRLLGVKDKSKELALQPQGPPGSQGPPGDPAFRT
jgi:hypothetical protein